MIVRTDKITGIRVRLFHESSAEAHYTPWFKISELWDRVSQQVDDQLTEQLTEEIKNKHEQTSRG